MLTWEEDMEAHGLLTRGWSISAIASHLGQDRETIRAYLSGQRVGRVLQRQRLVPHPHGDPFAVEPPMAEPNRSVDLDVAPALSRTGRPATAPCPGSAARRSTPHFALSPELGVARDVRIGGRLNLATSASRVDRLRRYPATSPSNAAEMLSMPPFSVSDRHPL